MLQHRKVTIVGAGIAGLALARALAHLDADVTVLEQAPEISEVGAGLQLTPNGARVLAALGLGEQAAEMGDASQAVELRNGETGQRVLRMALDGAGDFRFFHRADLIEMLLLGAAQAGVTIRTNAKVEKVKLGDHPPRLTLADGDTFETGVLIGADGLHSKVRAALNGTVAPFFTHQVAWRATLPETAAIEPIAQIWMGAGRHIVTYPLRGGRLRNIVAVEERRIWADESWSLTDDPITLRIAFEDFVPEVRGWLDRVEAPNLWGLFRHPVAGRWQGQGAAILGDAAHPTLPFLAQGANMALEDAWVLADCLGRLPVEEALPAYQSLRETRARRIVEAANTNARNYHLKGVARGAAHLALRLGGSLMPTAPLRRFDWLYGHDVTAATRALATAPAAG